MKRHQPYVVSIATTDLEEIIEIQAESFHDAEKQAKKWARFYGAACWDVVFGSLEQLGLECA